MFQRTLLITALLATTGAQAHYDGGRPDSHAPISVMADHTHDAGEWMLSYRYMGMAMSGARSGSSALNRNEAFAQIPGMGAMDMKALPHEMTMDMHMVGAMLAPTDNLTLMAMLPYVSRDMTTKTRMTMMGNVSADAFQAKTDGVGDASVSALYKLWDNQGYRLHVSLGLGLPTGSIEEQDYVPMKGEKVQLPYPMQPGSGSYQARPGITLNKQHPSWSWGIQAGANIALDDNEQGYKLGSRRHLTAWAAKPLTPWASVSLAGYKQWWSDIHGRSEDLTISPTMNPAADTDARGGQRLDMGLGLNVLARQGSLKGHRLALEYLVPVHQSLHGPQMETDHTVTVGWQKAFGG